MLCQNFCRSIRAAVVISCWLGCTLPVARLCHAQSSVVELRESAATSAASKVILTPASGASAAYTGRLNLIPNSLPEPFLRTESEMNQPTPRSWRAATTFGDIVRKMRQRGLQVLVDESAEDNNLTDDEEVRLALRSASISTNLNFALAAYECQFRITDDGIVQILSDDWGQDIDNFTTATYQISRLASDNDDARTIANLIMNTIDPDSWELNGGNGRIYPMPLENGPLITITQTYSNQRNVRQLLHNLAVLGGGPARTSLDAIDKSLASSPVLLPEDYLRFRNDGRDRSRFNRSGGGLGGGGGFGGGVF